MCTGCLGAGLLDALAAVNTVATLDALANLAAANALENSGMTT